MYANFIDYAVEENGKAKTRRTDFSSRRPATLASATAYLRRVFRPYKGEELDVHFVSVKRIRTFRSGSGIVVSELSR